MLNRNLNAEETQETMPKEPKLVSKMLFILSGMLKQKAGTY